MNETGKNRIDLWLFITAAVVLFRGTTFLLEMITSTLGVMLAGIPYVIIRHVIATLPVLGPVVAFVLAVLIARIVETRLIEIEGKKKRIFLVVLVVLALLPWQLQIKTIVQPVMWDEVPESVKQEMGLQQQGGGYSPPATRSSNPTP